MQFPFRDLTNQYISLSYHDVVQRYSEGTASYFLDGIGNVIAYVPSNSLGKKLITEDQVSPSVSSSWASHSYSSEISTFSLSSTFSDTASLAFESTFSDTSSLASYATYAGSASYSFSASIANSASYYPPFPDNIPSASWASESLSSSYVPNLYPPTYTSSLYGTASHAVSASHAPNLYPATYTSSLFGTASWAISVVNGTISDGASYNISTSFASSSISSSYANTSSYVSSIITKGGSFINPSGITTTGSFVVWQSPLSCTVTNVKGFRSGGTGAVVNAQKNNIGSILETSLTTTADTWTSSSTVQSQSFASGDTLSIWVQQITGSVTQLAIQVEFIT